MLSVIEYPPSKKTASKGQIDSYSGNKLYGWAYDPSDSELEVVVYAGGLKLGKGKAVEFRADLKDAGIGDGKHGYAISIDPVVFDGSKRLITLKNAGTEEVISSNEFYLEVNDVLSGKVTSVEHGCLIGQFHSEIDSSVESHQVTVFADDEPISVCDAVKTDENGNYTFALEIPSKLFDGMPHYITARVNGLPSEFTPYLDVFHSVLTPWEYIKESHKENNFNVLSKIAGYRYDSLRNHIKSPLQKNAGNDYYQNINLAHDIVTEGFENRKKYLLLKLPKVDHPTVSVIVPVYNKFNITYNCLASLVLSHNKVSYEVIVADDCSSDSTKNIGEVFENLGVVRNESNMGFLRNCNNAVKSAKGDYIVFLNNDTEVTSGWLDNMVSAFSTFNKVGAVGAKLIYPNGDLQEAGGIVWNNGQPWNIGNGQNELDPAFNYVRESDYLTGAALMLDKRVWEEVEGFSDEYAPAYYEDTDIAFKVRDKGYRTLFCPHSTVIHYEGMSNGTDLSAGVKKNQVLNAPKFRSKWRKAFKYNGEVGKNLHTEKDRGTDFRVLMIDHAVPRPDHDAGSYAAVQEMRLLQELGAKITFVPANLAHMGKYTYQLQSQGIEVLNAPFYSSIMQVLRERGEEFDIVYITRYDVAEEVIEHVRTFTNAKIIFNNADLHFLRELREALARGDEELSGPLATRDRELALMRKVDAVLSYNEMEHAVIMSHNLRSDNIYKCPWVLENKRSPVPFQERTGIAFLGGFGHPPNRESVDFFVKKVMPIIRTKSAGIKFHVYGSKVTEDVELLASEDVIIEGFVENLNTVFDTCRVFVAPLLSGAGIKGKVLESIAYGVPSVLSPIAAEATGLMHDHSTMIAESPEDWADMIIRLYEDRLQWQSISDNAADVASREYSKRNGLTKFQKVLDDLEIFPAGRDSALFSS